jgi:hypothetical protein
VAETTPWFVQAPKPKSQIETVTDAASYAHHSSLSARSKCPASADKYRILRDEIVEQGVLGPLDLPLTMVTRPVWEAGLVAADNACKAEAGSLGRQMATDSTYVEHDDTSAKVKTPTPAPGDGSKGGSGALLWLGLGGAALYLILKKKR